MKPNPAAAPAHTPRHSQRGNAAPATRAPAGSRLRAVPHWLVPVALYGVVAALVLTRFGGRLL
ncbi:hypothetical protein [Streptomyces sp. NPDC054961]